MNFNHDIVYLLYIYYFLLLTMEEHFSICEDCESCRMNKIKEFNKKMTTIDLTNSNDIQKIYDEGKNLLMILLVLLENQIYIQINLIKKYHSYINLFLTLIVLDIQKKPIVYWKNMVLKVHLIFMMFSTLYLNQNK